MAKIYENVVMAPDKLVGRIDADGKIYAYESDSKEEYIGWIDYEEGEVYNVDDELIGYIEEDGEIVAVYDDDDEESLGFVEEDGSLYLYPLVEEDEDEEEIEGEPSLVGKITEMEDATEGAAALLFFFDDSLEEEEEE